MRVAVGGIAHETNTFSTLPTAYEDFRITRGGELVSGAQWVAFCRENPDVTLIPLFAAHATPSGRVTRDAFEGLLGQLLTGLREAMPLDGVLLTLHGAMEVEGIGDGETAVVYAVRQELGEELPLAVTLDLHANLAPAVVDQSQIVTAYRTAPHRDATETHVRGIRLLADCLRRGVRPVTRMVKLPLLVAGEAAVTEVEPARSLYAGLGELETTYGVLGASILIGCAWTDSPHTAVAAVVSSSDGPAAEEAARALATRVWERRDEFAIDSAIAELPEALRMAAAATEGPVFISDSGDNTTAGAAGDSPYVLQYLVEHEVAGALVAGITDPAAVAACADAGAGAGVGLSLGGKLDAVHFAPFACRGVVRKLAAGSTEAGAHIGDRAVVRIGGVDAVLQSDRRPFTRLRHFHDVELDPAHYDMVVVKEGYLFPELRDYAPRHIMGLTPGFGDQRLDRLPFARLSRPIYPLDGEVSWSV